MEIKGRYCTIKYDGDRLLKRFDSKLMLGKLNSMMRKVDSLEDRVSAKIDLLIEKAEIVLDMFPDKLHINFVLLEDKDAVGDVYEKKYGKRKEYLAYYSLSEDTIYVSVRNTKTRIMAHEIAHAIVDQFFKVRPPYKIHELMAQYAEKHIKD